MSVTSTLRTILRGVIVVAGVGLGTLAPAAAVIEIVSAPVPMADVHAAAAGGEAAAASSRVRGVGYEYGVDRQNRGTARPMIGQAGPVHTAIRLVHVGYAPRSVAELRTETRTANGRFWCQNHPAPGIRNPPDGDSQVRSGTRAPRLGGPRPRFAQCL